MENHPPECWWDPLSGLWVHLDQVDQGPSLQLTKAFYCLRQHVQDGWVLLLSHLTERLRLCSSCLQHQDGKFAIHDASARDLSLPKVPSCDLSALLFKFFAEITAIAKSEKQERERARERERESRLQHKPQIPRHQDISAFIGLWYFKKSLQSNLLGGWHPIQSPSIQYHRHFFAKLPSTERTLQYQVAEMV